MQLPEQGVVVVRKVNDRLSDRWIDASALVAILRVWGLKNDVRNSQPADRPLVSSDPTLPLSIALILYMSQAICSEPQCGRDAVEALYCLIAVGMGMPLCSLALDVISFCKTEWYYILHELMYVPQI